MTKKLVVFAASVLAVTLTTACQDQPAPTAPELPIQAAPGGGGSALLGEVSPGDFVGTATAIQSTCPGSVQPAQWHVNFGHSLCLIVSPDWNAASGYQPYTLTDDLVLVMRKEKGTKGRITSMSLIGQDVMGDLGIFHETDFVPVAIPVVPTKAGYMLHVHAARMEVWRTDAHTGGGNRVAMIGWISIGDIVVRPQ